MKKEIVIDGEKSDWYERAIFILKEDIQNNKVPKKLSSYAEELIEDYIKKTPIYTQKITKQSVQKRINMFLGISITIFAISLLIPYSRSHKNKGYKNTTVADLLGEVKVSGITSIPCIISGEIIGRGNPGCIFSEDFVIRDDTGIIFLDYNQPLAIINTFFALLKSKQYINKNVEIKGWYRRCPVPYIEIHSITLDGKTKKCYTYGVTKGLIYGLVVVGVVIAIKSIL